MTAPILSRADAGASYDPSISTAPAPAATHGIARRFVERFALIAFGLYHLPLFLNNYPSLGGGGFNDTGLAPQWGRIFTIPSLWVARVIFHVAKPGGATGDNGDTSEEYARLFISVVIGLVGAIAWTVADRKRPRGEWVESTNRVMLRFSIVLGLMSYALAKILPQQFPPIAIGTLDARVGNLTPMSLLWTFMQYSRPYAFFGGFMELVACVLLCFRRTALLGAMVCLAVMTNVTLMNYLYAVPVKLYATMITLSAAVLVLYDSRRLLDLLVFNRPAPASSESTILQDRVPASWRRAIKFVAVASVALSSLVAMNWSTEGKLASSPAEGTWNVISTTPASPWRKLSIDPVGIIVRTATDSAFRCKLTPAAGAAPTSPLSIACPRNHTGELQWNRAGDTLRLQGRFDDAPLDIAAVRVERQNYPLIRAKFRWIFE